MEEKVEELEKDKTPILLEDLGTKYPTETSKQKTRYGIYQCQYCGKEFEAPIRNIKKGLTKSCGCQSNKFKNPHGLWRHPVYNTWNMMKQRCYNPKYQCYKDYGGRGIQVCERWLDVKNFIDDMYPSYQEGLTLDRINIDGNYAPDNCRWATKEVQSRNTRDLRVNNTSGYRGVCWHSRDKVWISQINAYSKHIVLGSYQTALEAAKAYERYVRVNNLEHNFTPALTEEEIIEVEKCYNILA